MKHLLLVFILFHLFLGQSMAQGPWSAGKGKGYAQILFTAIPNYSTLFAGGGDTRPTERELSDRTLSAYVEYGVTNGITLSANLPYVFVGSGSFTGEVANPITLAGNLNNFGNISLGAKATIYHKDLFTAAFILQVDLPTGAFEQPTGLSTGYDALTLFPKLSFGLAQNDWFAYGYFGYGVRNNNYNHVLNYGVEAGVAASENVRLILNINAVNALNNGAPEVDAPTSLATGFYTSIQEYNAFLLKLLIENIAGNLGVLFSFGGGSGNSVAVSPALSAGVFYKW